MRRATNIARKQLISLGTCIGKFTKSGKFHLHVTALDLIAPYAKVHVHAMYTCMYVEVTNKCVYVSVWERRELEVRAKRSRVN